MKSGVDRSAELEFTHQYLDIRADVSERFDDQARILKSGTVIFNLSEKVTREDWAVFAGYLAIGKELQGVQGFGFSLLIPRTELASHVRNIRREGFPEYSVKPDGVREVYSSIIYLEPFSGRNLRAFGYDMFSEPTRRAAMERARDTNSVALSGKVTLAQETNVDVQAGILMYVPVYRKGLPVETVEQRRAAIYGWVYSPFRMNDLMKGRLGDSSLEKGRRLQLRIYDGEQLTHQNLLYESTPAGGQKYLSDVRFTSQVPLEMYGHRWTMSFTKTGGGLFTAEYTMTWAMVAGGAVTSLLLFALIRSLLGTSAKAEQMAKKLTIDLTEREQFTTDVLNSLTSNIAVLDKDGIIMAVNDPWRKFALDNSSSDTIISDIGKMYLSERSGCIDETDDEWDDAAIKGLHAVLGGEQDRFALEYPCHSPLEKRWFIMNVSEFHGSRSGAVVSHSDITWRKQLENNLLSALKTTEASNATMSRLLGTVAHEFRTSLGLLACSTDILDRYWDRLTPGKRSEQHEHIRRATRQLTNLVNSVIAFNYPGADKIIKPPPLLLDIGGLCSIIAAEIEIVWSNGLECDVRITGYCGTALLDEVLFRRVLENLLNNAFRYTPADGRVSLCLSREKNLLLMEVVDNGIGIPEDDQELIFDSFYRSRNVEGRRGMGLGLSIVQEALVQMGGTIAVKSKTGEGTTMSVTIPLIDSTQN